MAFIVLAVSISTRKAAIALLGRLRRLEGQKRARTHARRSLPTLEKRLETRLLDLDTLHRERPNLPSALARARAGQWIDELLDEIGELQRLIDTAPPETLEDAAVNLRRLGAYVEQGQPARLRAEALTAVERVAARST